MVMVFMHGNKAILPTIPHEYLGSAYLGDCFRGGICLQPKLIIYPQRKFVEFMSSSVIFTK